MNRTQRITLFALGLGQFMVFLDVLAANVALPEIQRDFGVGEDGLQWLVASYSLAMAVVIMSSATLADIQGRRRWYLIGVFLFSLGSIGCGLAPSIAVLTAARAAQGVGAAIVSVTSLALLSAAFPEAKQKARAIGFWAAIGSLGTATGPTVGGLLVELWGWRSIFYVNVPVGLLVLLLTLSSVKESRADGLRHFDLPGQVLFAVTVGAFTYAIIEGPQRGWTSLEIIALFSTAAVGCAIFLWLERRSPHAMMDLTLFRNRSYAVAITTICTAFFAIYGMLLLTTQFLQNVRGLSAGLAGLMILPFSASIVVASPLVGQMVGRMGARIPVLAGLGTLMAGLLTLVVSDHRSMILILLGLGLCGIGWALCKTPITTIAMTAVPETRAGMASGIMSAQRAIGSTLGFAVMGSVLAAWLTMTLEPHLEPAVADPIARHSIAREMIGSANPRAHVSEIAPARTIVQQDLVKLAEDDFIDGISLALLLGVVSLAVVFFAGWRWLPRGPGVTVTDAEPAAAGTSH